MKHIPFYDPTQSYEYNFQEGPFGAFSQDQKYINKKEPQYNLLGIPINLPFGIAAGPLLNSTFTNAALDKGFDMVIYKTVRTKKHPCHDWPNIVPIITPKDISPEAAQAGVFQADEYQEPLAITNSFGVPSADPSFWQKDMEKSVKYAKKGQLVIGSFQGTAQGNGDIQTYINDFVHAAQLVKETGCKVLEANLSCPNEGSSNLLCFDIERTQQIVYAIKEMIGNTPLILKMAYFPEQAHLETFIKEIGPLVQGLATINTIPGKIYKSDGTQALPGAGRLVSGICGAPIKWAGLDMVNRISKIRQQLDLSFSIIGVGGVSNVADYKEYLSQGADAVMCATGAMWNPYLAQQIKETITTQINGYTFNTQT